ncbi:MAG TPA: PKD domain-containing protein, partial [Ferruginibacter sp.]|nr:PKD domain-containing protein [Ferruginibacter sp.]
VNAADTVTVVASPASICNGASSTLTATANLSGNTFAWSPAATLSAATGSTVTASPSSTTQYQVIGTAPNGCKDTALVTVTVNPKPNASFTFNPSSGCPRRKRKFEFISTSTPSNGLTYAWNFGDPNSGGNNTSNNNNPQHSFIGTGFGNSQSFTVTLIVTTPSGCKDTASTVISVGAFPDAALEGTPPLQTYNGEPYFYQCDSSQHTFTFYNMSSTAAINTNYVINWGDASPNYTSTTWGTGVANAITHNYAVGTHQLILYVYAGSCVDTALYNVFIGSNPGGSISSPSSTQGCTGTTFSFPFANVMGNSPGTDYYIYVN